MINISIRIDPYVSNGVQHLECHYSMFILFVYKVIIAHQPFFNNLLHVLYSLCKTISCSECRVLD